MTVNEGKGRSDFHMENILISFDKLHDILMGKCKNITFKMGRYGSGGRAVVWQSEGCRFDPTLGVSKCPWARRLILNCSWRARLVPCVAANRRWCVNVCVNGWMRGINCTALWIKVLYKCSPFTCDGGGGSPGCLLAWVAPWIQTGLEPLNYSSKWSGMWYTSVSGSSPEMTANISACEVENPSVVAQGNPDAALESNLCTHRTCACSDWFR